MLQIDNLEVHYGKVQALQSVSIQVAEGERVGLIGPNGAGKSTLLRAVFGMVSFSGDVRFTGESLRGRRTEKIVRLGLAHVPEGRHIFQSLTVAENLSLGWVACADKPSSSRLADVLDIFPILRTYFEEPAAGLSGGEQQQLAIARALLASPRFIALDEPSLGLAPKVVRDVFQVLERLNDEGTTILLVEQNAVQTVAMTHRTYVLSGGKVVAEGGRGELESAEHLRDAYLGRQIG